MRPPTDAETPVLEYLFAVAGINDDPRALLVAPMNDGDMGSLLFVNPNAADRRFGGRVAECCFDDSDGIMVSVALNVDQNGELFELDSWKVDFSKLRKWPTRAEIRVGESS